MVKQVFIYLFAGIFEDLIMVGNAVNLWLFIFIFLEVLNECFFGRLRSGYIVQTWYLIVSLTLYNLIFLNVKLLKMC